MKVAAAQANRERKAERAKLKGEVPCAQAL